MTGGSTKAILRWVQKVLDISSLTIHSSQTQRRWSKRSKSWRKVFAAHSARTHFAGLVTATLCPSLSLYLAQQGISKAYCGFTEEFGWGYHVNVSGNFVSYKPSLPPSFWFGLVPTSGSSSGITEATLYRLCGRLINLTTNFSIRVRLRWSRTSIWTNLCELCLCSPSL